MLSSKAFLEMVCSIGEGSWHAQSEDNNRGKRGMGKIPKGKSAQTWCFQGTWVYRGCIGLTFSLGQQVCILPTMDQIPFQLWGIQDVTKAGVCLYGAHFLGEGTVGVQ